jgi:pimeloyl-ACP methyl ester carboxylesterase
MKKTLLLFLLLTMISPSCAPQMTSSTNFQGIPLTDCVLSSPNVQNQVDAQCGSLTVPENPSNLQGRKISLNIAVVPAIKRNPEPDPLFILAGGPGQAVIEVFPALYGTLYRVHEERDIVLVDQRGTGKSNPLRCIDPEDETLKKDEEVVALLKECPQKLDADLKYYTTDIAMQDLDRVRAALGYPSINLYSVSYGTRAALVYLKLFPERVRSIVLDAVVDPAFILNRDTARDGQRALDLFFARCEADEACHSAFPNLKSEFDALLKKAEATPVELTLAHPVTGRPFELTMDWTILTDTVFNTLYVPDLVAMLPFAIHQAYTEENYAPLIAQSYLMNAGIYDGMFYAVTCTEDAPLVSSEEIDQQSEESLFTGMAKTFLEVCAAWPQGQPPQVVHAAVSSDVPLLMLSGEADPVTPPWHAEQFAQSVENDLHLVFQDMGHGNSSNQCAAVIIAQFIEQGSISNIETDCVGQVEPPPFFVDFSGPQP